MEPCCKRVTLAVIIAVLFLAPTTALGQHGAPSTQRTLTPKDVLETARIMDDPPSISPDGKRFVVRMVRGDVARDGVWLEVVSGSLESLAAARRVSTGMRLFSPGRGRKNSMVGPDADTHALLNPLRWVGNDRVAFFWSDQKGARQIVTADLEKGNIDQLTHTQEPIVTFDIAANGAMIYNEQMVRSCDRSLASSREGFTIREGTEGFGVLAGCFDGLSTLDRLWNSRWFVKSDTGDVHPVKFGGQTEDITLPYGRTLSISPDTEFAIVSGPALEIPEIWDKYSVPFYRDIIRSFWRNPQEFMARRAIQLYIVNMEDGQAKPLWGAMAPLNIPATWSPDGRFVLLAPTFLPPSEADAAGLAGRSVAVVEVSSGHFRKIPIDVPEQSVVMTRWQTQNTIEIDVTPTGSAASSTQVFTLRDDEWRRSEQAPTPMEHQTVPLRVEIRQDLNTPPKIVVVDLATRKEEMIFDPNQEFEKEFELGRVERLSGSLSSGQKWTGLLFYPVRYQAGRRYPLLIQSVLGGTDPGQFTLSGWQHGAGLGPTPIAVYPGQLLTQHGIAVLTLDRPSGGVGPSEGPSRAEGVEAVVNQLVTSGLIDGARVGLAGFSRGGFHVEYVITHSKYPYAAALIADNFDPSYVPTALLNWRADSEVVIGAPPFGSGLQQWLAEAPGFNSEKIRPPVLMVGQTNDLLTYVVGSWELFSRLRHLKKPVEMYLMPEIDEHPSHSPQNPTQILALQGRAIDWFNFWLNGDEDHNPKKAEQYQRWRKLRELHEADMKRMQVQPPATAAH